MSDRTPLVNNNQHSRYNDDEETEQIYEGELISLSKPMRYTIYAAAGILSIVALYFFVFYLPNQFVPQAVELKDINKVEKMNIELIPVNEKVAKSWSNSDSSQDNDYAYDMHINEDYESLDKDTNSYNLDDFEDGEGINSSKKRSPKKVERIIMIGDIHGHYIELEKLLKKIKFNVKTDHLLVLGDFISKGPDSFKVLEYLSRNNIDCILGNHEYLAIQNYVQFHNLDLPGFINPDKRHQDKYLNTLGKFNDDPEFLMAKKFEPKHIKYINKCPIMKTIDDVPFYSKKAGKDIFEGVETQETRNGAAVHAGLRWDLSIYDQDPLENLNMRVLIGPNFNESSEEPSTPNSVSWAKIWNQHQNELPSASSKVVYYGHDARKGLNLKSFSKGMDSGCDRGDKLLAIISWKEIVDNKVIYKEKVEQVSC